MEAYKGDSVIATVTVTESFFRAYTFLNLIESFFVSYRSLTNVSIWTAYWMGYMEGVWLANPSNKYESIHFYSYDLANWSNIWWFYRFCSYTRPKEEYNLRKLLTTKRQ